MRSWIIIFFSTCQTILHAQQFEQDFSTSSIIGDYVSATPGSTLFNSISSSGAGVSVSIYDSRLRFVRAGANTGSFTRNTDMTGPPASLILQFDLSVTGSTTPATSIALFYIGNNFSTTNTTEANADVFTRFSVNTTAVDGSFQMRDITNGTNSSMLSGTVRITWVMNNSGATKEYKAPDGTISSIASGKADLWGGALLLFNDVSVQTPSQTIADIKFITNQGSQTIDIDNILIDPIPAPPVSSSATSVGAHSFIANWTPVAGANGYRLDVSKQSNFSTFVNGYEGLYISGGGTTSASVSGLLWGNTYFYRVRSSADYSVAELESGHSNVTPVITGILPTVFTRIHAEKVDDKVKVSFDVASELDIKYYRLQKSNDAENFAYTNVSSPAKNDGNSHQYLLTYQFAGDLSAFYRIVAVSNNGQVQYSNVVSVRSQETGRIFITIMCNPVINRSLSFMPGNFPDGTSTVNILSTSGELLLRKEIIFRKGSLVTIPLHRFQAGSYILLVKGVMQFSELFVIGQ